MQSSNRGSKYTFVKKGTVLKYCVTRAELENLYHEHPQDLNPEVKKLASCGFFEKTAGIGQFLRDFTVGVTFYIDEERNIGVTQEKISKILALPDERKTKEVTAILASKFGANAIFVIDASGQQVAGFVYTVSATGINNNNPADYTLTPMEDPSNPAQNIKTEVTSSFKIFRTPVIEDYQAPKPFFGEKYIDVFKNPADDQIYFISITKHLKLVSLPGSEKASAPTEFGVIDAPSMVIYRLEDYSLQPNDPNFDPNKPKKAFKFVAAEYDNDDLYLMAAKNESVPATELKARYFSQKPPADKDFDFLALLHKYKEKLKKDTKESPEKIEQLRKLINGHKEHLKKVILESLSSIVFESLTTFDPLNHKNLAQTTPIIEEIGAELKRTGKYNGHYASLITESCAQAILKYMGLRELEDILNSAMHPIDRLAKFEVVFRQNLENISQLRGGMTNRLFIAAAQYTVGYQSYSEEFVRNVLKVIAESQPETPNISPFSTYPTLNRF